MRIQSTVRVCQMSDLHYSGKNLAESERCFAYAVDRAIAAGRTAWSSAGTRPTMDRGTRRPSRPWRAIFGAWPIIARSSCCRERSATSRPAPSRYSRCSAVVTRSWWPSGSSRWPCSRAAAGPSPRDGDSTRFPTAHGCSSRAFPRVNKASVAAVVGATHRRPTRWGGNGESVARPGTGAPGCPRTRYPDRRRIARHRQRLHH